MLGWGMIRALVLERLRERLQKEIVVGEMKEGEHRWRVLELARQFLPNFDTGGTKS